MARRKGLGKGLGALIPEKEININENTNQIQMVDIKDIKISSGNPRKNFDMESIESLAESIKMYGVLQPLVLIKENDKYKIVAGERRFRAAKTAKLKEVPAIIKELTGRDQDMISMIENIQREDLNPYEEAMAYTNMMKKYNLTQQELSDILGKSRTYIANMVRLINLDEKTIEEIENGNITSSQGRALLGIENIEERHKYLELLLKNEITVNEIEKTKNTKKRKQVKKDIFVRDLEDRLKESLGTKVRINKSRNKWTVNIEFSNDEQIEEFLSHYNLGE
ncbi:ParB/RepB/Spo0J family partition protein [Helcococcus sueciensis]|uniref:ParB/RepB/Spo0J family partition protein n=1 Tax=Helcococcus sueciensis TaxID=241555 RepID=UPI00040EB65B|nr:ParB/RepB/Spo0J family partition protein [Helcococcus sueciensis]